MKEIKFKRLRINGFRAQHIDFDFADGVTKIEGRNKAGKSTILDAILWCLLGVDSEDRTNYRLFDENKPFAYETAEPVDVELEVVVDGVSTRFKRIAQQKWVRKRGRNEYEKSANDDYKYIIDGIEVNAGAYKGYVESNICSVDKAKLILNILHYLSLDWRDLRKHFFDIVGEITDDMLTGDYSEIDALIKAKGDLAKPSLDSRRSELKKNQNAVAAEIEALKAMSPDLTPVSEAQEAVDSLERRIKEITTEMVDFDARMKPFESAWNDHINRVNELRKKLAEAEMEYAGNISKKERLLLSELNIARNDEESAIINNNGIASRRLKLNERIESESSSLKYWQGEYDRLREESESVKAEVFEESKFVNCRICGTPLTGELLQKAQNDFIENKQSRREQIRQRGITAKKMIEQSEERIEDMTRELASVKEKNIDLLRGKTEAARKDYNDFMAGKVKFAETDAYKSIDAEIAAAEEKAPIPPSYDRATELKQERDELLESIKKYSPILALPLQKERNDEAIAQKKSLLAQIADELAKVERLQMMFVEKERERAEVLGKLANRYLDGATVKMTAMQKSGEIIDTCEIRDDAGVSSGVTNSASQIKVGVAVSRCFQNALGVKLPLLIDNYERLDKTTQSEIESVGGQIVTLEVSDCDLKINGILS